MQHATKNEDGYKLHPYGPIEELAPGLWRVVGELQVPMKRSMFVYRLPDGTLLVDSVVAMEEADMQKLEALGRPSVMTIPHPKHLMDAKFYKARYPDLKVFGEPDAQAKIDGLVFDATLEIGLPPYGITPHPVPGMKMAEVALELPLEGNARALLFVDLVNRNNEATGLVGFLMKLFGPSGDGGVAPILKLTQIDDKYQVRAYLRRLAALPSLAIIAGCHGGVVTRNCAQWLTDAAERL